MLIGIYGQKEGAGNTTLRESEGLGVIEIGNSKGRAEGVQVG